MSRAVNVKRMWYFISNILLNTTIQATHCTRPIITLTDYLSLGFTKTTIYGEERPQCVVYLTALASDSMKSNKLRRHLETKHVELVNKPKEFFARKCSSFQSTQQTFQKMTTVHSKALLASFKVAHRISKCKKPHTVGEILILPAAVDIVSTMFGDNLAQQLKSIPLSNDTVSRRISDISEYLNEQLFEKLKNNVFGLKVDEATDKHRQSFLLAYVRFIDDKDIREEILFCKPLTTNATGKGTFDIIDNFFKQHDVIWMKCVGLCTDGARAMAGQYNWLQGLVKAVAPNIKWTHCIIHREALASKDLSLSLNEFLQTVVKTVNLIKAEPLQSRLFKVLCEEIGSEHTALLFHTEARWLSRSFDLFQVTYLTEIVFSCLGSSSFLEFCFFVLI
ncbi:zinc finger BED domain-containing protein 5-like [Myzus persicae]|uniref:zinc finger BED domain-containing protein 5-like n=1 Tax=Myzus persicae TaxID=13164 RepID=UPI000B930F01|nr:zinc finger BED domain-containing protein 5-like [Myzus persicae]